MITSRNLECRLSNAGRYTRLFHPKTRRLEGVVERETIGCRREEAKGRVACRKGGL